MAELHFHRCDCDVCLNGPIALRIPVAGAVFKVKASKPPPPTGLELRESEPVLAFSPELTVRGE